MLLKIAARESGRLKYRRMPRRRIDSLRCARDESREVIFQGVRDLRGSR
jgi:hypothetical protein